jgi:lysophospholipase L1-like esterase
MTIWGRRALALGAAMLTTVTAATITATTGSAGPATASGSTGEQGQGSRERWSTAWATAPQASNAGRPWLGPNWSREGFADQTVRQVVRVSAGGASVRVRLSNLYGSSSLHIAGATIGQSDGGASVRPGTTRPLRFGGRPAATIPAGGGLASDAVRLPIRPLEHLTVTLYLAQPTGPATFHELALATTYRAPGDQRLDAGGEAFTDTSHSWYYLAGIDVAGDATGAGRPGGTVVTFGDSITDGAISTPGTDNRYPDELAERLVAAGLPLGVANVGINGNKLLTDSTCYGERGVTRFRRDVLGQPNVRTAIVLAGINDIIHPLGGVDADCETPPPVTAEQIIEGHRAMIGAAHARGVRVVGATLLPFKGNPLYNESTAAIRTEVNDWIRTSGEYDAVIDLARALADPTDAETLRPEYASFDNLHPNDAGMAAIAQAIDPASLTPALQRS